MDNILFTILFIILFTTNSQCQALSGRQSAYFRDTLAPHLGHRWLHWVWVVDILTASE